MGEGYNLIEIVFLASIAIFLLLRLRQILGRRTGNERRRDPFAAREQVASPNAKDKVAAPLAGPADRAAPTDESRTKIGQVAPEGSALNQGLTAIQAADRQFDVDRFTSGARAAYEIIVDAFAKGDKTALRPLLSDEVFAHFSTAIDGRARRGETMDFKLVAIKDARITQAKLDGKQAEITVTFETEIITATKNDAGAIVSGDPSTVVTVIDIWSFARDVKAKGPDWILSSTDTAE
jgi:predicted lipid-binding transport protein (Tim44 family)